MKKILVTGGAGFIGSHLCKLLIRNKKNKVFRLDNLKTGSLNNIKELDKYENFEYVDHDIVNKLKIKVDFIYNFACPASPIHYQLDPLDTIKTNVFGMFNMLDLAKENGAPILHSSTSEVYGDPIEHPQKETYFGNVNPIGPRSCYDEGKRCAETICFDYVRKYNLNVKVIRIFNTYGPNMSINDGRVVSNFITQALKNKGISIYGDGKQTRSLCYVDDLIRGIISFSKIDKKINHPINLGNDSEITILSLAHKVIELTNSKSKIKFFDLPEDDPKIRKPDIKKAKKILNWQPEINLDNGLNKTINYFKKIIVN